jgi:NADH-quinone oxidoreductase subunit F
VDLHIVGGEPTAEERDAVDALLGPPDSGWAGGPRDTGRDGRAAAGGRSVADGRHLLLPAFHAVQDRVGWVSRGAMNHICRRLSVPPAEAWGVLTFYHLLATEPRPRAVAHVCDDIACRLRGAETLCRELEARLGPPLHGAGPGAPHVREGEVGDAVFLIVKGKVKVFTGGGELPERVLSELGAGACLGEMAVFDAAPRSATVAAVMPTRVLVLPGAEFKSLLAERGDMAQAIIAELVRRMRGLMAG